ncbi:YihY/virulence factor BrkB family protein [Peristeroidobacter agariperforans]|uniref:YihY/virulence factor BrkB family protein n=1 Tax=Peristeroidobacter agariperforans TaxID=268404 RepID=UPI00101C94BE|nr:YihY/virulence factor BrkB family protein [Peristeroidobacter agariperforans]
MNPWISAHSSLLRAAAGEYVRDYAHYFAGAMVYYALLSLVPLLVLFMAAMGWLLRLSPLAVDLEQQLLRTVEATFGSDLSSAVEQVSLYLQRGSIVATMIGIVGLLMTSSKLFAHLRLTFRALWKQAPPLASGSILNALRMKLTERAIAFGIMFGGGALLLALLAVIGALQWLAALPGELSLLGDTLGWLLPLLASLVIAPLIFALLLRALPPAQVRWSDVRVAAVLLGLTWILGAEVLSVYAARAAAKWSAYGAIGGLLMVMLWMHAMSKMLFFGAELSKVTYRARTSTERTPPAQRCDPVRAPGTVATISGSSGD